MFINSPSVERIISPSEFSSSLPAGFTFCNSFGSRSRTVCLFSGSLVVDIYPFGL
ncbi:MAG: hypothetical protein UW03_C0012G0006 [Candidatus Peregrinibacteria bacterium GW2011_GWA2_43_8]|nr:MAG: hypothetical protein UW03_C0012G0006 [Candidatus Peregrinibacteria bacterium GW2011_GWA2_43_8]